jgi:hypothetical protein
MSARDVARVDLLPVLHETSVLSLNRLNPRLRTILIKVSPLDTVHVQSGGGWKGVYVVGI